MVPGANLAVTAEAENLLARGGALVLPDFLAGSGASLSMEGLFAPQEHPTPPQILAHVEQRMAGLVRQTLTRSTAEGITPTQAARRICAETVPQPGTRPYGNPLRDDMPSHPIDFQLQAISTPPRNFWRCSTSRGG